MIKISIICLFQIFLFWSLPHFLKKAYTEIAIFNGPTKNQCSIIILGFYVVAHKKEIKKQAEKDILVENDLRYLQQ